MLLYASHPDPEQYYVGCYRTVFDDCCTDRRVCSKCIVQHLLDHFICTWKPTVHLLVGSGNLRSNCLCPCVVQQVRIAEAGSLLHQVTNYAGVFVSEKSDLRSEKHVLTSLSSGWLSTPLL